MFQKEVIGNTTLYCGDSTEVLAYLRDMNEDFQVDCFVTDPPYGLGKRTGTISKSRQHKNEYESNFEDSEEYIQDVVVPIIEFLMPHSKRGAITPGSKCAWYYPKPEVLGGFLHPATTGMCSWGRTTYQPILFYGKDPRSGITIQHITKSVTEKAMTDEHPCAKPLNGWTWLVDRVSLEGELVIDPFMGAGTTGVACANLNRSFIGIEMESKYFDLACREIENAYKQPTLFEGPVSKRKLEHEFKEKQNSMF